MKRQLLLPAFLWHKTDVSPDSLTWLVALDQCSGLYPSLFPFRDRTHCFISISRCWPCLALIYSLLLSSFTSSFPGTWSHWLPACVVWQLPEHWGLKISSNCLSPATTFQSIFRATFSFGALKNYSSFSVSNLFHSQFRLWYPYLRMQI